MTLLYEFKSIINEYRASENLEKATAFQINKIHGNLKITFSMERGIIVNSDPQKVSDPMNLSALFQRSD